MSWSNALCLDSSLVRKPLCLSIFHSEEAALDLRRRRRMMITFTLIVVYMPWLHVKLEPQTTGSKSQRLIFTSYAAVQESIDAVLYGQ
jgi:hypothetical protein